MEQKKTDLKLQEAVIQMEEEEEEMRQKEKALKERAARLKAISVTEGDGRSTAHSQIVPRSVGHSVTSSVIHERTKEWVRSVEKSEHSGDRQSMKSLNRQMTNLGKSSDSQRRINELESQLEKAHKLLGQKPAVGIDGFEENGTHKWGRESGGNGTPRSRKTPVGCRKEETSRRSSRS